MKLNRNKRKKERCPHTLKPTRPMFPKSFAWQWWNSGRSMMRMFPWENSLWLGNFSTRQSLVESWLSLIGGGWRRIPTWRSGFNSRLRGHGRLDRGEEAKRWSLGRTTFPVYVYDRRFHCRIQVQVGRPQRNGPGGHLSEAWFKKTIIYRRPVDGVVLCSEINAPPLALQHILHHPSPLPPTPARKIKGIFEGIFTTASVTTWWKSIPDAPSCA